MDKKQKSKNQKRVSVANFNIVFMGEKEESPLLDYFDDILGLP